MNSHTCRFRIAIAVAFGLHFAPAAPAFAQPSVHNDAQQPPNTALEADLLFNEGMRLKGQQKYAEALSKFEASYQAEETLGALWHAADCYEMIGRTWSAWTKFRSVEAKARSAGIPRYQELARQRTLLLQANLAYLHVETAGSIRDVVITLNGSPLPLAEWGKAIPVDPGPQTIVANAPGMKKSEQRVEATQATTTRVNVELVPEPLIEPPKSPPKPVMEPPPAPLKPAVGQPRLPPNPAIKPPQPPDVSKIAGWISIGSSAVTLTIATGFTVHAISKKKESDHAMARDGRCTQACVDAWNEGRTAATIAVVAWPVWLVSGAAGAYLLIRSDLRSAPARSPQLAGSPIATKVDVRLSW